MTKYFLFFLAAFLPTIMQAQITKPGEKFSAVYTINNKVIFIKEIKGTDDPDKNYVILRNWAKVNYAKDHFNSSINNEINNKKVVIRSSVSLLLPPNSQGLRESFLMRYHIIGQIKGNLCIIEITNMRFINNQDGNNNTLPLNMEAESIISDEAIAKEDSNKETRINLQRSTINFLNSLMDSLTNDFEK